MPRADALKMAAELINARFPAPAHGRDAPTPHEWSNAVLRLARFLMLDDEKGTDSE